jgi:two-component system, OmpR family, sensor histidine kinase KdpD
MRTGTLSTRRRAWGYCLAVAAPMLLLPALVPLRGTVNLAGDVAIYLVLVVAAALVGGLGPALVASVVSAGVLNLFFTRPYHRLTINDPDNVVALCAFVLVAVMVSWLVDVAERRAAVAAAAAEIEAADRLRAAILTAVGHDLRSPLAAAKAVVSGLRAEDVTLDERDRRELLEAADGALDRLAGLVDNLLDMSRLQAGALPIHLRPIAIEDVLTRALDYLGVEPRAVLLEVEEGLPDVLVDAGLLERAVANIVANAQRFAPAGQPPVVRVDADGGTVRLHVIDHGRGIPETARDQVFQPFQRLGDTGTGLGLGLALARGLVGAMGGTVTPTDTPGGGLTMVVTLPVGNTP